jgi:hypothetical protein
MIPLRVDERSHCVLRSSGATNLRYLPHHLAWHVTQMSTGRPRSTLKLRSRSAFAWILRCGQPPQVARADSHRRRGYRHSLRCRRDQFDDRDCECESWDTLTAPSQTSAFSKIAIPEDVRKLLRSMMPSADAIMSNDRIELASNYLAITGNTSF